MEADEVKMYLDRMIEVQGHIEAVRREFGRSVILDIETLYHLEALVQEMDEYDGWWEYLKVPKPTSEFELLELLLLNGWVASDEWPDESFCDEMVYETISEFAKMVLETMGRKPADG